MIRSKKIFIIICIAIFSTSAFADESLGSIFAYAETKEGRKAVLSIKCATKWEDNYCSAFKVTREMTYNGGRVVVSSFEFDNKFYIVFRMSIIEEMRKWPITGMYFGLTTGTFAAGTWGRGAALPIWALLPVAVVADGLKAPFTALRTGVRNRRLRKKIKKLNHIIKFHEFSKETRDRFDMINGEKRRKKIKFKRPNILFYAYQHAKWVITYMSK